MGSLPITRFYQHALPAPGEGVIWNEGIREDTTVTTAISPLHPRKLK